MDAIVNSTNESMSERNPVSDRICARAGPALREEIRQEIKGECVDNTCVNKYLTFVIVIVNTL